MKKNLKTQNHVSANVSQFELTKYTLNNLLQFDITPVAKLVLLYLTDCYNPKNADVFPKQSTIAKTLGVSERSVVRAVQELFEQGIILIECKKTNRYKFTSKLGFEVSSNEKSKKAAQEHDVKLHVFEPAQEQKKEQDKLSDGEKCVGQIDGQSSAKMSAPCIEQKKEQKNSLSEQVKPAKNVENNGEDFKILLDFAQAQGARNKVAYARAMMANGTADAVIQRAKASKQRLVDTRALLEAQRENAKNCKKPAEFDFEEAREFIQKTHPILRSRSITCKMLAQKFGLTLAG